MSSSLNQLVNVEVTFFVDMELETDNCRNLTIFPEVVVSIEASLLTHEVVEVEET